MSFNVVSVNFLVLLFHSINLSGNINEVALVMFMMNFSPVTIQARTILSHANVTSGLSNEFTSPSPYYAQIRVLHNSGFVRENNR
jgi:hypothetical protein